MDRALEGIEPAVEVLRSAFGEEAVGNIDTSHPRVPALTVTIDGLEFWVSYLPMPVPPAELDLPTLVKANLFLSPEEDAAFLGHRSFFVLAQKGGGTSLAEKRRVCWTFSRLCGALLELEGAVGVRAGERGLLVSRRSYRNHLSHMEATQLDNGDGYFPIPLWVWLVGGKEGDKLVVQTLGMGDFGLPELGFYAPQRPISQIMNFLFTMASRQLTGREQPYYSGALIPLDETTEVICKGDDQRLLFIGG